MKTIKAKSFFYGVHPKGMKELSKAEHTKVMPLPEEVAISTTQSLGKPALPVVEVGQKVKAGTLIAKADGAISSNVFASVSGEVTQIQKLVGARGNEETYIFVKSDGTDQKEWLTPLENPTPEEIKERIFAAGVVGLGGAGFPTAVKLAPRSPVDTLILNGAECEPYLTCDYRIMMENTDQIVAGARYIAKALGVKNILIGIETNKPDALEAFEKYDDIQPVALKKQYPMGSEKHLIYVCTGRKVGIGKLPADSGVAVNNVSTALAVQQAVEQGKPLYESLLTVSGGAAAKPQNVWFRVGTSIREIVDYCGGEKATPKKVINGGPMTGVALSSYDLYTSKTTSGILLLSESEAAAYEPTPCLSCGKCADVCPMRLMPMQTEFYAQAGDYESAAKYGNTMSCIECGACEFICPAKRPLVQSIRKTKAAMRKK